MTGLSLSGIKKPALSGWFWLGTLSMIPNHFLKLGICVSLFYKSIVKQSSIVILQGYRYITELSEPPFIHPYQKFITQFHCRIRKNSINTTVRTECSTSITIVYPLNDGVSIKNLPAIEAAALLAG